VSFLRSRGHDVEALTTASAAPADPSVHWVSRRLPPGVRHGLFTVRLAKLARRFDVIYTMSVLGRSSAGARAARTPYVVKLPDDPAYERARRLTGFRGSLGEFQSAPGLRLSGLRSARTAALRAAARIICPSEYLRALALGWGLAPEQVVVLPNPAPEVPPLPARDELRRRLELNGQLLVFAGRMNAQKSLDVALDALARTEATLVLLGEGPDRPRLEERAGALGLDSRARFLGPQPRERVLELFRAADASLLSSSWENFPHTVVESLAVGTPVISTAVGGVPEVVTDGSNGLLVPPGDPEVLADAIQRFFGDEELRQRLRAGASGSLARFAPEHVYSEIERVLQEAAE
jgi:glycosyltransferase involved in cell wall biosynthesis